MISITEGASLSHWNLSCQTLSISGGWDSNRYFSCSYMDIKPFLLCAGKYEKKHGICHDDLSSLQWRHNEPGGVSNHRRVHSLFNYLFRRRSKKTSKLRVTGICMGNSPIKAAKVSVSFFNLPEVPVCNALQWHHVSVMASQITGTSIVCSTVSSS